MEILRNIQKQAPLSPAMQIFFIHFPQMQLLYLFLVSQSIPFYNDILDIVKVESLVVMKILVIGQLCARTFLTTVLGLRYFGFTEKKSALEILVLKFLKVKIKILIVISLNWNTLAYKYCPNPYAAIALFNLVVTIGQLLATRILNSSYRFEQENLICQKNTSLLSSMLLFPIIFLLDYYDLFYASCLIIIRCLVQIYFNFNNMENRAIQYCQYFSPLVMMSFCLIQIQSYFSGVQLLNSQNIIFFMVVFTFTLYSSHCLTQTLMVIVPKYHLKKCSYFTKNEDEQSFLQNQGTTSFNEDQEEEFVIALRVLAKMYVTRQKLWGLFQVKQNPYHPTTVNQQQFNSWWKQFNQIIINHRMFCNKVTCQCMKITQLGKDNDRIASAVFLDIMFSSLQKVISCTHSTKLSIIEKYFYIELLQKPIKNYYQLIKLKGQIKKSQEILQVESLMQQTRHMFRHLLNKEKAQNQELQIGALLKFQHDLSDMKLEFVELATHYKSFYDLFSNSFVEMSLLKKLTTRLTTIKQSISQKIALQQIKFSRNLEFLSYSLIYYKYFDEYTDNIQKTQSKINTLNELNLTLTPGVQTSKKNVDVFDPIYGSIKIDLVWRSGQIISATKNICALLGFRKDQLEGQKINKIMPHIFARFHDRFMRNFVEKGSMNMLKQKERIFFARNFQKFILPIIVRLKIEYMSNEGFYASSLIKKASTKSQFILLNNYGKIQQISQKLYRLLFQKGFKDEISKIKRINVFKMLLSLNHFVKYPEEMDGRIYEGVITTVENEELLQSYYKLLELGIDKIKKRGENSNTNTSEDIHSNRSYKSSSSFMESASFGSFEEIKSSSEEIFDGLKCKNDMKEMLKDYFSRVNLNQIKAYRVMYKFYDLVTSQFTCKVLQIVSIQDEVLPNELKIELPRQIIEIGQLYGLGQEELGKFKNIDADMNEDNSSKNLSVTVKNPNSKRRCSQPIDDQTLLTANQVNEKQFMAKQLQQGRDLQQCGSVGSLNSNAQKLQRKSTIISSFDLKIKINENLQSILTLLTLSIALALIIICIFSTTLKPDYNNLQQDNLIISNFKINFQFRLVMKELEHFYNTFDMRVPTFIKEKQKILSDRMKQQLINSIEWIDKTISTELYFDPLVRTHANANYEESRPIITTLSKIYSSFLMTDEQNDHLSDNYQVIRDQLESLSDNQKKLIISASSGFMTKIHVIVGIYSLVLFVIVLIFAKLNQESKQKQQKIVDFLPFVSLKQVREKAIFYEELIDYMKENQEITLAQIQTIEIQKSVEYQEEKRILEMANYKKSPQLHAFGKQKTQFINSAKQDSSSRFIRVIKSKENNLTFKNCLIIILLIAVCLAVVISTEYFFSQAHSKFIAYIQLKESAMMVENLGPRTLLTHMINIDRIANSKQLVSFPDYYYNAPVLQLFDARLKLATTQNNDTELAIALNKHLNSQICQLVVCSEDDLVAKGTDVYYLVYRFINALQYTKKIIPNIQPLTSNPKQQLKKWIREGNIEQLLQSIQHVLQLMTKNQLDITLLFSQQIDLISFSLLYFSLTLIPLLIMSLYFVRQKFAQFVYGRLSSVETVYKQFAWNILSENTYVVNYFQNKLRNSKQY